MAFSLVMLAVGLWLLYTLVTDPHGALNSGTLISKVAVIGSPLLVVFFIYQALRATRDIRARPN